MRAHPGPTLQEREGEGQREPGARRDVVEDEGEGERRVPLIRVVWSAMIAFQVERKAPSATPETTAARTSHRGSVVTAKTSSEGGRMTDATMRRPFRPRRSE